MKTQNYLKNLAATVVLTAFTVGSVFCQPAAPSGKQWVKDEDFSDEFDTWDADKWENTTWNYGKPVNMTDDNYGVWDGHLYIKASLGTGDRWFNTSRVRSKGRISFPVYIECKMQTSHLSAFSTFWLNYGNSNDRDEIDICEHNTNPSWPNQNARPYTMYSQYFIVENGVTERHHGNFDNRNLSNGNPAKGVTWNATHQVLGCYWKDKNNVQFYINGEEAGSVRSTKDFTRSLHIIWDLWTSPHEWTGGIADKNNLDNDDMNGMYVDWVHTYKLEDTRRNKSAEKSQNVVSNNDLTVYPNPAKDNLTLTGIADGAYTATIFDIQGKVINVLNVESSNSQAELNISDLSQGIYLLEVENEGVNTTVRFVKE